MLATEREPEGQAQRSNLGTAFGLHKIWIILAAPRHCSSKLGTAFGLHKIWSRYKVLACSEVVSLPVAEGVASLHPRLLKLSPPATILYAVNKPILSTGDNRYIVPKNYFWPKALRFSNRFLLDFSRSDLKECCQAEISTQIAARVALALRAPVRSRALRGLHRFTQIF